MIRVIAIDDHPLILKAVTDEIKLQHDMCIVGTADQGSKLHALVRETSPDVVILDLSMDREIFEPVSAVQQLLQEHPQIKVLILTVDDSPIYIRDLIEAGALGYLLKCENLTLELAKGVRTIYEGQRFYSPEVMKILLAAGNQSDTILTKRELQVLRIAAEGYQTEQIGKVAGITGKWVRNVLSDIYTKLKIPVEVNQRVAAINKARELGLLAGK